ncbi:MAG: biofilm PGA synthesis N-glycosyltransferase PgaC [Alteromonadaceae bacterium]|jgi:biofilm PGA synthesis N-glycosyltransferase PgaC
MVFLFFFCVVTFIYTFIGYPILLQFYANKNHSSDLASPIMQDLPEITILLCIYNSADKLEARITNIFDSDYPANKLNLIIVSDGSTDDPQHVVDKVNNDKVTYIEYIDNKGKSHALNVGLREVKTELVAFTDVRQSFNDQALKNLVMNFSDKTIGAVSGNLEILKDEQNMENDPGLYWKYEKWIRENESKLDSMLGVTGAIYMARHSLIPIIPEDTLLDDMYTPMHMIKNGFKIKFETLAIAYDSSSASTAEEFHRKVRTLAGNFQLISQFPWLMHPTKNPLFWQFFSHKVLRLLMPYCLTLLLLSSFLLEDTLFNYFFWAQIGFYLYSMIAFLMIKRAKELPFASICTSFCSLQLASLLAGWKYQFSSTDKLWKKH